MASRMLAVITAQGHGEEAHLQKLQPLLWCEELPASLLVATVDFGVLGVKRHFGDPDVFQRDNTASKIMHRKRTPGR